MLERKGRDKRASETSCVVASCTHPTGNLVHNLGMCTDWELNQWPFGSQASTQSTGPYQPGQESPFLVNPWDDSASSKSFATCEDPKAVGPATPHQNY